MRRKQVQTPLCFDRFGVEVTPEGEFCELVYSLLEIIEYEDVPAIVLQEAARLHLRLRAGNWPPN